MLVITRDGAKIIDKKMKFKEDLLSRRKQERLIFKYLFQFDSWLLEFFIIFLVVCIPMSFLYFSILTSENVEYGIIGKIICSFLAFVLHFLVTIVFVSSDCNSCEQTFFKLSKRVSTRLEQIDSSIIDTTLEERTEIAEWFIEEERLVGIRKDSNDSYTLFYRNSGNIDEERVYLCIHKIPITTEISNQMIKGYVYSISDLLTYNARSNKE
jgi:hypothetical protein